MRCNWVHLTYNWGFPPEIEQEDWDAFEQAATAYHQAGVFVIYGVLFALSVLALIGIEEHRPALQEGSNLSQ